MTDSVFESVKLSVIMQPSLSSESRRLCDRFDSPVQSAEHETAYLVVQISFDEACIGTDTFPSKIEFLLGTIERTDLDAIMSIDTSELCVLILVAIVDERARIDEQFVLHPTTQHRT